MSRLSRLLGRSFRWLFVLGVLITTYEVVLRYVFGAPTIWAQELTILISAAAFLVGGLYTLERGEHIAVTVLSDRASRRTNRMVEILSMVLGVVFLAAIAWGGRKDAWEALSGWQTTASAFDSPSPAILKPLLVVVAALMIVQLVVNTLKRRKGGGA